MKYSIIILIALIANGCGYGQYPRLSYQQLNDGKRNLEHPFDYENTHSDTMPENHFLWIDSIEVITDSAAFELLKQGSKPYPVYNPVTKKTVWCIRFIFTRMPLYVDTTGGKRTITTIPQGTGVIQFDSSLIYYQRFNKYNKLFNDELARLNNFKKPTITQRLLDYQDSLIRYKILLNRLKK